MSRRRKTPQTPVRDRIKSWVWGVICFIIGTIAGLVVQEQFFALFPGPKVYATLQVEPVKTAGQPDCTYYKFRFTNFGPVEYMRVELQFPKQVTDFKIGGFQETILANRDRHGGFFFGKGYDDQNKCAILQSTLTHNPDIVATSNGHIIEMHSSSKLATGTPLVGLIATSDIQGQMEVSPASELIANGEYEFSKWGHNVKKTLPIETFVGK